ncbi:MAG TPA: hypothetical protein VGG30_11630 [Pirellulales bacterium]|jgi:hypothetical protein
MVTPPQIRKNSQWVIDNFGPQSGLERFGYDAESVAYLDAFIDRQGESFRANQKSLDRIVSLLGAFVGEAIIATHGGEWHENAHGISIVVKRGDTAHILQPFDKVRARVTAGPADSLLDYFSVLLPVVLSGPGPQRAEEPKKPWWKLF